ncbi:DUF4365 domain-containing protein [Acidimicrobiaceae bacterium USS-CC1]|uniref:DUF4365 domain-containing protein n=1 Tax=Acidiferrimicrobium australe TaxID=2664430 RepID=A0ABW9QUA5_9ACTN|nr:DUF4365 domain-containing protein [Acidiferrimicrobium australe]
MALIAKRVGEMGYLFHPRRVDHGIDGHIDLVDPSSSELLNLTLLVQSKASTLPFPDETDQGFRYTCDQRDLDLWLGGNAPVILVLSHPDNDHAWWVDVRDAFSSPAARAARVVYVDKRTQVFDTAAAAGLRAVALPRDTGLYLPAAPIQETLTTNLLEVADWPASLHLARTNARDYPEAGKRLQSSGIRAGGWMLRDGFVISFRDLTEAPLNALCDSDVESHATAEWAESSDLDTQHRFMDLLTRTVQDAHPELRWHKERRHLHFLASQDLRPRLAGKGHGNRGRTVFAPHYSKSDPGRVSYYHHAALRLRFRRLAGQWFAQLEPDYCFTSDGSAESRIADSLLAGIKRLDRHPAVAGWTRMWANHLRGGDDLFSPDRIVAFGDLATVTVDRGIDDRWWGPAPAEATIEDERDLQPTASVDASLIAAGVDADELTLLLTGEDRPPQRPGRASQRSRRPQGGKR